MEAKKRSGNSLAYNFPVEPSSGTERERSAEKSSPQKSAETEDPELARYLNRTYWENRPKEENSSEETGVSGTPNKGSVTSEKSGSKSLAWNSTNYSFLPSAPIKENRDKGEQAEGIDTFVENLRGQIEMFVNRMKSNSSRGRPIAYDTSVQGLFMNITTLHSQLLNFIQVQDNARSMNCFISLANIRFQLC